MRRFTDHLVGRRTLAADPMLGLTLPPAGKPRCNYLETVDAKRLADTQPSPYREFSALLAGSGIDVSVALKIRKRDVDVANREIRAAGTKTYDRDRIVRVAEWAWPYVERLLNGLLADALVFSGIPDRRVAGDVHRDACEVLIARGFTIYTGYTMRDHRHTFAVRAIRAGTPAEIVAKQMGHVDGTLVTKVYGRFAPTQAERDKWERIAAAQDEAVENR
jgi:integrase